MNLTIVALDSERTKRFAETLPGLPALAAEESSA